MPAPYRDRYVVCAENGLGGKIVEHVLRNFVHAVDELGDHRASDPFVGLDAAVRAVPPGAGGLLFLPWLGGSNAPQGDDTMRGGFVNMSLTTTRADMLRAAVEGVAHNLRWLLRPVEAFTGNRVDEIALVGRRGPIGRVVPGARRRSRSPRARSRCSRRRHRPRHRLARARTHRDVVASRSRPRAQRRREPLRTRPCEPQPLRRSTRTVRGCLRCPSPDQ